MRTRVGAQIAQGILALAGITGFVAASSCGSDAALNGDASPTPTQTALPTPSPTPEGDDNVFRIAPVAASGFVYVANTDNDDIAKIDTVTRHISVIPVGKAPVDLAVSASGSRIVTFDSGSRDVSVVDGATGTPTALTVRAVTNSLQSSPLCTHGIAFYSSARDPGGAILGSQNPAEVSVVDYVAKTVTSSVMGGIPRQIAFTPDDSLALVLADGLLAKIDLLSPAKTRTFIPIDTDPSTAPAAREIQVAPDGSTAFVLTADPAGALVSVDLTAKTFSSVPVGGPGEVPTDLDQSFDGRFFIIASLGTTNSTIDLFDRQNALARTSVPIPGPAGSVEVAPDRDELWAFSRSALDERIWRVELNPAPSGPAPVVTEYALVKPVRSVFVAGNGAGVIVLHRFTDVHDGVPANEDAFTSDDVMTVIDPDTGGGVPLLSPVALAGPPDLVALTSDGAFAFAQIPTKDLALIIDLGSLLVDAIPLSSTPRFVGAVPSAHTGYFLQKHALGRLSFVVPETLDVQTVTGFEINGEIQ